MPARSNAFQRFIKYIHSVIEPLAVARRESEILSDDGDDREIDIYVEMPSFNGVFKIGIECRDHSRPQDIDWIDSLIGKTIDLKLNRVIAVSSSGFTKKAVKKAKRKNIDLLTLEEAASVDWALKFHDPQKEWKQLTHKYGLCRLGAFNEKRETLIGIIIDKGQDVKYENELSREIHPLLEEFFMKNYAARTAREFDKLLYGEAWLQKFDDPTSNYFEVEFGGIENLDFSGQTIPVRSFWFGIVVDYKIQDARVSAEVLGDKLIRTFEAPQDELGLPNRTFLSLISDKDGRFLGSTSYEENQPFKHKPTTKKGKEAAKPKEAASMTGGSRA
ncbi:hypothetical protein GCM10007874_58590 [Labrys miyagiensis]|uniref:Restriction endonuclease type IV Mrr domain-containing protein n=1 Tax=Labrys miyagiensis TaxID=346912 RepID=A0ABQ6CRS2_9HYPH|nr:restriction endonuclease [Labrys miyagiensis]GLS22839.1 hypothetical protein GCM10007874_58590 [Labrys miyagiensis]